MPCVSFVMHDLLATLAARFAANPARHVGVSWPDIAGRLEAAPELQRIVAAMEETGGEPDVVILDAAAPPVFCDCAPESPSGRRSTCYDGAARRARRANPPATSALEQAEAIGIRLLTDEEYRALQTFGPFDTKTSSWIATPDDVRARGGALFGDWRYGRVFTYHNGADSYFGARGFRGLVPLT